MTPNTAFVLLLGVAGLLAVAAPRSIASLLSAGALGSKGDDLTVRCLVVPASSDVPVHLLSYALLALLMLGAMIGGYVFLDNWRRTNRLVRRYLATPIDARAFVDALARDAGLAGRIDVVAGDEPRCFCYGLVRPRVCVTTGLVDTLDAVELEAVLRHEAFHVRNRDPLRLLLGKALTSTFFFVPTLRDLFAHYRLHIEVAADRRAVREMGEPRSLAAALDKLLDAGVVEPAILPGVAHRGSLEMRIDNLLGEPVQPALATRRPRLAISMLILALVIAPTLAQFLAVEHELLALLASTPHAGC